jgi:hypothetical protein
MPLFPERSSVRAGLPFFDAAALAQVLENEALFIERTNVRSFKQRV